MKDYPLKVISPKKVLQGEGRRSRYTRMDWASYPLKGNLGGGVERGWGGTITLEGSCRYP
jgi:hypothetical protein